MLQTSDEAVEDSGHAADDYPTAFSLARFVPLLTERIHVMNPFTRTFLVSWINLLDSIPDLELVYYLPAFLGGLFNFLSDPVKDVQVVTQGCLERFLTEVKRIAQVKRDLANRKGRGQDSIRSSMLIERTQPEAGGGNEEGKPDDASVGGRSSTIDDGDSSTESDWVPGQDVFVDHPRILEILVTFLDTKEANDTNTGTFSDVHTHHRHSEEDIQLTALRWIDCFFEICPEDILPFVPRLLAQVLPAMSNPIGEVRQAAHRVNTSLTEYIVSLSRLRQDDEQPTSSEGKPGNGPSKDTSTKDDRDGPSKGGTQQSAHNTDSGKRKAEADVPSSQEPVSLSTSEGKPDLDYASAVKALTLQFHNEREATRIAALTWLIMFHRMAPRKVCLTRREGGYQVLERSSLIDVAGARHQR